MCRKLEVEGNKYLQLLQYMLLNVYCTTVQIRMVWCDVKFSSFIGQCSLHWSHVTVSMSNKMNEAEM